MPRAISRALRIHANGVDLTMKAKLTTVYRLTGINKLPTDADLILFNDQQHNVRVYLTVDVQPLNELLLSTAAAGMLVLSVMTGGLPGNTSLDRYRSAYELATKNGLPATPGAVFLVVEVEGQGAGPPKGEKLIEIGKIAIWLGTGGAPTFAEKPKFEAKAEAAFHQAIVAFSITGKSLTPSFEKRGAGIYLIDPKTGCHIVPLTFSGSGRATVSSAIANEVAQEIVAQSIPAVEDAASLGSIFQLLSQSYDERLLPQSNVDDDARRLLLFTLVWTSLEKMIGKIYTFNSSPVANLKCQFKAIARALDPANAEDDIKNLANYIKLGRIYFIGHKCRDCLVMKQGNYL